MAVPVFRKFFYPVLDIISNGEVYTINEVYEKIVKYFNFTNDDLKEKTKKGTKTKIYDRIYWSLNYMKHTPLIENVSWGKYRITDEGLEIIKNPNINDFDENFLNRYPEFVKFKTGKTPELDFNKLNMDHRRVWRISPGSIDIADEMSKYFIENNYVAIGFNNVINADDLRVFKSKKDIERHIADFKGKNEIKQNANQVWTFLNEVNIGDIVLLNHGRSAIYAIGIIDSDYLHISELNIEPINGYVRCRKVKWIVTNEFQLEKYTLNRHTISEIKYDLWNEILLKYLSNFPEIKKQLFQDIYSEFLETYRNTDEGKKHISRYSEESIIFKENFERINRDNEKGIDVTNNVLKNLISPKGTLFDFYTDFKNFIINKYDLNDDKLKELSLYLLKIFNIFSTEKDNNLLVKVLEEFDSNKLSKGIKVGLLSPSLYFLNNDYYAINNKTINALQLMSGFIDEKMVLDTSLPKYLVNNKLYHDFLIKISNLEETLGIFEEFDIFGHWLYDSKLGNYSNGKMLPLYYSNNEKIRKPIINTVKKFNINNILLEKGYLFEYLTDNNLIFKSTLVENYLLSLKVKPFIILTGNNGTGKTRLAKEFANYLGTDYSIVPVGSNWTDNHNIVGYFNPFTKDYYEPEALKLIKNVNNEEPSFLILDEMNLSHVEHYFSDVLSAMESDEGIPLNVNTSENHDNKLYLSDNLFIIGTVNIDETTYMFSPKVLDRANVIEFKTVTPKQYLEYDNEENILSYNKDIEFLTNPLEGIEVRNMNPEDIRKEFSDVKIRVKQDNQFYEVSLNDTLVEVLTKFYEELSECSFDFGFRVINEIYKFMYVSWIYEGKPSEFINWNRYLDAQVKQKLLPRLHGSEYALKNTLVSLKIICSSYKFKSSENKLEEMIKVLKRDKFVSFIN